MRGQRTPGLSVNATPSRKVTSWVVVVTPG